MFFLRGFGHSSALFPTQYDALKTWADRVPIPLFSTPNNHLIALGAFCFPRTRGQTIFFFFFFFFCQGTLPMGTDAPSPPYYCPSNGSPAPKLMVTATFLAQWASWSINAQKGFDRTSSFTLQSPPSHLPTCTPVIHPQCPHGHYQTGWRGVWERSISLSQSP